MDNNIRTRFAPSPTGLLHVGGARTALFNWMYAKKKLGKFILRIEDTDQTRNNREAEFVITNGLRWLGLDWDEGPDKGGEYGPYFQSQRHEIYEKYLNLLSEKGFLYEDNGAIRFRSFRKTVIVEDAICGRILFDMSNPALHPDMTIRRADGTWIFHFVNVVDDIEMKISHVIRGEDHLSNTPKHLELYHAFSVHPPQFAHLPLILNTDGSKMSKRDEGASLASYQKELYVPEAIRNYLTLLGWSPKENREIMPIEEMIQIFELADINRKNASFDKNKCFWIHSQYLLKMSPQRYAELALPILEEAKIKLDEKEMDIFINKIIPFIQPKIKNLRDIPNWISFFFSDHFAYDTIALEKFLNNHESKKYLEILLSEYSQLSEWNTIILEKTLKTVAEKLKLKVGELVHPARIAVTGKTVGAGLYDILHVLGQKKTVERFQRFIYTLNS